MHMNGKIVKMSFEGKNLKEMGRRFMILKKKIGPHEGAGLPQPLGNTHVYNHNIQ